MLALILNVTMVPPTIEALFEEQWFVGSSES